MIVIQRPQRAILILSLLLLLLLLTLLSAQNTQRSMDCRSIYGNCHPLNLLQIIKGILICSLYFAVLFNMFFGAHCNDINRPPNKQINHMASARPYLASIRLHNPISSPVS